MNNQKKALLVALAVAGVSISGPMVKWSLSCGASPVMIAFGRAEKRDDPALRAAGMVRLAKRRIYAINPIPLRELGLIFV